MKKTKAQQTEERILEAALNLFAEKGYTAAATSEIAKEANISEGTIFRYFPQKKDLLIRVIAKFIDLFGEQMVIVPLEKIYDENQDADPEALLRKIVLNRLELFEKMSDPIKVLIIEMQYHPELKDMFINSVVNRGVQYGEKVYRHFVETGFFRDDIHAFIAFRSLMGIIAAMAVQRKAHPKATLEGWSIEKEADAVIDIFINGVKKREDVR